MSTNGSYRTWQETVGRMPLEEVARSGGLTGVTNWRRASKSAPFHPPSLQRNAPRWSSSQAQ